jgi:hypothetical protein
MINTMELEPHIQKQIEAGSNGLDIIHGQLKILMLDAEQQLELAQAAEDVSGEAMDSMERKYWEGVLDAYGDLYSLTYALSFAIMDKEANNG